MADLQLESAQKESSGLRGRRPVPDCGKIILPAGYDPLALLDQLEGLYDFNLRTSKCLPPQHVQEVDYTSLRGLC